MRLRFPLASIFAAACATAAPAGDATVTPHGETAADYAALHEIFPEGMPTLLTPESIASAYRLPAGIKPPDNKLPTRVEYTDGPFKWDVNTNVTTRKTVTSVVPVPKDPYIAGGAAGAGGEVKGQIRYTAGEWELYGTQSFGSYQGDGVDPTFNDTTTFGSLYKLPGWMAGGKIGASLELHAHDNRKTRIEYRQPFGGAEGYVAAEQLYTRGSPEPLTPSVRAGVNRKF